MAYRNGTYVAFHAEGNPDPTASDIRYYRMLLAWHANDNFKFNLINSHDKVAAVRDSSKAETLRRSLIERLNVSTRLLLIMGDRTRWDRDWVPFEIAYAIDKCALPLIIAYTGYNRILAPNALRNLWPTALATRIDNGSARAIHVPFRQKAIDDAIRRFDVNKQPEGSLVHFTESAHLHFGL